MEKDSPCDISISVEPTKAIPEANSSGGISFCIHKPLYDIPEIITTIWTIDICIIHYSDSLFDIRRSINCMIHSIRIDSKTISRLLKWIVIKPYQKCECKFPVPVSDHGNTVLHTHFRLHTSLYHGHVVYWPPSRPHISSHLTTPTRFNFNIL